MVIDILMKQKSSFGKLGFGNKFLSDSRKLPKQYLPPKHLLWYSVQIFKLFRKRARLGGKFHSLINKVEDVYKIVDLKEDSRLIYGNDSPGELSVDKGMFV